MLRKRADHCGGGLTLLLPASLQGFRASLAVPQLQVHDISCVDWAALRSAGFTGVVFDKDNTLTVPYVNTVHPPLAESLAQCLAVFDGRAVILRCAALPPPPPPPPSTQLRCPTHLLPVNSPPLPAPDKRPSPFQTAPAPATRRVCLSLMPAAQRRLLCRRHWGCPSFAMVRCSRLIPRHTSNTC